MLSPIQASPKNSASVSTRPKRVVLVHIRDPQFYAIPGNVRGKNGRLQIMGFPPIGIMSLSSVLKRAGHEVLLFDQANPETPNEVIVAEVLRWKPDLVGMSFLSTTSYPYAKILARELRAADSRGQARLRRRLRDAERASTSSGRSPKWTSSAAATASS